MHIQLNEFKRLFGFMLMSMLALCVLLSSEANADYQRTADNTVPAYTDRELRNRIGNERVDRGDVVTVFEESGNSYYVRYPTPRGSKDRWVPKNIFNGGSNNNVRVVQPSEGDYFILPESNGSFAIDVKGGGQAPAGTPVWIYQRNDSDAQLFTLRRVNGDWYKIVHKRTGLVINVQNGNDNNGTQMWLYYDDGTDSCYWRFIDAGNGSYIVQSKLGSNRVFDLQNNNAFNGAALHLWQYHTNQAARWKLVKASGSTPQPSGDVRQKLMYAVFKNNGARITCDFDGYQNISGRHEGIDMVLSHRAPVYAAISGIVTRAGGSYNTVAIYDQNNNKTVVYLHFDSITVRAGQYVNKGDHIGYQGSTGASASHVHIEVRNGRREAAAKSVNDPTLDNPNPYDYWNKVL